MPCTLKYIQKIPTRLISFSLCFFNVMLLMLTHGSHGWTTYHPEIDLISAGLWVFCSRKHGCQPLKTADVYLNAIRAFMVIGLLTSVIAMLWSVEWDHIIHCKFVFLPKPLITAIFNFIAGFSVLIAVLIFEFKYNRRSASVAAARKWAFYLSHIISILCFLSGVYNLLNYKWALWGTGVPIVEKPSEVVRKDSEATPTLLL